MEEVNETNIVEKLNLNKPIDIVVNNRLVSDLNVLKIKDIIENEIDS